MKLYRKKALQQMRPYVPGEDMSQISIENGIEPEEGGMIAVSSENPLDIWYISPEFFANNYEEVE